MNVIHSKHIKHMADQTGKTYRYLEGEWNQAQKEFEFDQMMNPNKYSRLSSKEGTIAQEINKRFEEKVLKPLEHVEEEVEEKISDAGEEKAAEKMEKEMEKEMEVDVEMPEEITEEGFEDIKNEVSDFEPESPENEFEDIKSDVEKTEETPEESEEMPEELEDRSPTKRPI